MLKYKKVSPVENPCRVMEHFFGSSQVSCHHVSSLRRKDSVWWPKSHSGSQVGREPRAGDSGASVGLFHKHQREGRESSRLVCTGSGGGACVSGSPCGQCTPLLTALEQAVPCPLPPSAGDRHPHRENPPGSVNTARSSWKGNDVVILLKLGSSFYFGEIKKAFG